ncbi:MAG: type II toxin-antitoxin system VapB family antitoxin [Candidatus Dormibacteria bacterium]
MSKTLVDIDTALLEEAKRQLGTQTIKDTVNQALEAVVARSRRQRLADLLVSGGLPDLGSKDSPCPHHPPIREGRPSAPAG